MAIVGCPLFGSKKSPFSYECPVSCPSTVHEPPKLESHHNDNQSYNVWHNYLSCHPFSSKVATLLNSSKPPHFTPRNTYELQDWLSAPLARVLELVKVFDPTGWIGRIRRGTLGLDIQKCLQMSSKIHKNSKDFRVSEALKAPLLSKTIEETAREC